MSIEKYGRFFAVYESAALVCVCVYKKGAAEVVRRLSEIKEPISVSFENNQERETLAA